MSEASFNAWGPVVIERATKSGITNQEKKIKDFLESLSSFVPSEKSRHHNRCSVWTEALSAMTFLVSLKLSGI